MISVACFCGRGFPRLALLFGRILEKFCTYIYIYMYFYMRLMLAVDVVIPISSTSLPGGNLVDGLPPASSMSVAHTQYASRFSSCRLLGA